MVVKVDTLAAGSCYAEMLRRAGGSAADDVGLPTMFLSHAWRCRNTHKSLMTDVLSISGMSRFWQTHRG